MELANGAHEVIRLEFPGWIIHQLQRILPHLDAMTQGASKTHGELVAYPLQDWNLQAVASQGAITVHLRDGRQVDAAFHIDLAQAGALQEALGHAIKQAAVAAPTQAKGTRSAAH